MAYSGTRTFNLSIEEIIEEAFERCGLEVRSGYDLRSARRSLNLMFADWANRGLNFMDHRLCYTNNDTWYKLLFYK